MQKKSENMQKVLKTLNLVSLLQNILKFVCILEDATKQKILKYIEYLQKAKTYTT